MQNKNIKSEWVLDCKAFYGNRPQMFESMGYVKKNREFTLNDFIYLMTQVVCGNDSKNGNWNFIFVYIFDKWNGIVHWFVVEANWLNESQKIFSKKN